MRIVCRKIAVLTKALGHVTPQDKFRTTNQRCFTVTEYLDKLPSLQLEAR